MNDPSGPVWSIAGLQIWNTTEPTITKGFSLVTADGPKHFYGTRETLLRIGRELVKAAEAMPRPS